MENSKPTDTPALSISSSNGTHLPHTPIAPLQPHQLPFSPLFYTQPLLSFLPILSNLQTKWRSAAGRKPLNYDTLASIDLFDISIHAFVQVFEYENYSMALGKNCVTPKTTETSRCVVVCAICIVFCSHQHAQLQST